MDTVYLILGIGLLVFIGHFLNRLFERIRIPDVLFLIVLGLLAGPVFHLISPADFGVLGPVFASIAAIIILFESGISIRFKNIRESLPEASALTIISFVLTALVSAVMVHVILQFTWLPSFMFGAMIGGTSSAVVIPVVKHLVVTKRTMTTLILESAVSDVLCIICFMALYQISLAGTFSAADIALDLVMTFLVAVIAGTISGLGWAVLTGRFRHSSTIFATPAFVFILYAVVELAGYSGFIAALCFGITLGNLDFFSTNLFQRRIDTDEIDLTKRERFFFTEIVFIIKTFFFLYIGLAITLDNANLLIMAFVLSFIILLLRIPVTWLCIPRIHPVQDASIIAITIPKGLAAAVLATLAVTDGIPNSDSIAALVYGVILFSILLYSIMTFLIQIPQIGGLYNRMFRAFGTEEENDNKYAYDAVLPATLPSSYYYDIHDIFEDEETDE